MYGLEKYAAFCWRKVLTDLSFFGGMEDFSLAVDDSQFLDIVVRFDAGKQFVDFGGMSKSPLMCVCL